MRNFVLAVLSFFFLVCASARDYSRPELYSAAVPEILAGIWQGSDRLVLFSPDSNIYTCVLGLLPVV